MLVSSPSYALVIGQALQEAGVDPADAAAPARAVRRRAVGRADAGRDRARAGAAAVDFYGLSEMCGPGVATECLTVRDGLHVRRTTSSSR